MKSLTTKTLNRLTPDNSDCGRLWPTLQDSGWLQMTTDEFGWLRKTPTSDNSGQLRRLLMILYDSGWLRIASDNSGWLQTTPDYFRELRMTSTPGDSWRIRMAPDGSKRLQIMLGRPTFRSRFLNICIRLRIFVNFTHPYTNDKRRHRTCQWLDAPSA